MSGRDGETHDDEAFSRRRFVQGVGAAGLAAGLAGCSGQSGGGGGGSGGGGSGASPKDSALTFAQWAVPSDSQYNPYNDKNNAEPRRTLFDRFMQENIQKNKFQSYAIQDWSVKPKSVSLTLRDGMKWHNGDDVTPQDVVTKLKLDMYTGGSLGNFTDDISKAVRKRENKKVKIDLDRKINEEIVLALLQPKRLDTKHSEYKENLNALENASGDKARSEAQTKLFEKTVPKPIGSGPFKFDTADSQRTLLTKFEDHPDAGKINFPEMEYLYMPTNQKRWNALINNRTDGSATLFMPQNKVKQLPKSVQMGLIARHTGLGIVFNYGNEHFKKRKVRQAVAHVIDRQAAAKNSGAGTGSKLPVEIPCCITEGETNDVKQKWLKGVAGKFNKYDTNTQKAASLLKSAGYRKQGGTWKDGSGNALKAPIKGPAGFTDWIAAAETMVSNLKQFGIDSTLLSKDTATYWGKDYANGEFTLALQGWSSYDQRYPYFHFDYVYRGSDATDVWQMPKTFAVSPLKNPSGAQQERKPAETVDKLSRANEKQAREHIQQLAWVTNRALPVLPIMEKLAQTFQTTDDWKGPPKDSPKIQTYWPTEWLERRGDWTAKTN